MSIDIENNNDEARMQSEGHFVVLEKIKEALDERFNMQAVIEPSNAVARREIRVMAFDIELNRVPAQPFVSYVPFEGVMKAVISMRVSGGNTNRYLSAQAMQYTIAMEQYLMHELFIVKDIGQKLDDLKPIDDAFNWSEIVGDAEIISVKRDESQSGWSGNKEDDNHSNSDELFVYRKDYQVLIGLTIHRHFYNPVIKKLVFINDINGEVLEVPDDSERT